MESNVSQRAVLEKNFLKFVQAGQDGSEGNDGSEGVFINASTGKLEYRIVRLATTGAALDSSA
jgi:hypothetical protein